LSDGLLCILPGFLQCSQTFSKRHHCRERIGLDYRVVARNLEVMVVKEFQFVVVVLGSGARGGDEGANRSDRIIQMCDMLFSVRT
jgi:hypothetical protein